MFATCPTNPDHDEFITPVHVMQDVKVSATGEFREVVQDLEMTHGPDTGNIWVCATCGAEATVAD